MQYREGALVAMPLFVPAFVNRLRNILPMTNGSLPKAVEALFKERNITIEIAEGDTSIFKQAPGQPKRGILVVGDHRQGLESAGALAFLGMMGRDDVSFIAKPYSIPAKLINAAMQGIPSSSAVLPVVPPELTKEGSSGMLSGDMYFKVMNSRRLLSRSQATRVNIRSLQSAAQILQEGHCVVISPTSGVKDSLNTPWEKGLGLVALKVKPEYRGSVYVVYARFDDFSKIDLIWSLLGKRKKSLTLRLRLSEAVSLGSTILDERSAGAEDWIDGIRKRLTVGFRKDE